MKAVLSLVALSLAAAPALAGDIPAAGPSAVATRGAMLVDAHGGRLAQVSRVDPDGSAEIVFEGRVVTVPSSTLALNNGRLTTSLGRNQVASLR